MKIGLLIIGSEVLDGKISDLNTRFLSEYLRKNHFELMLQLTVKDNQTDIHQGLKFISNHCDVIVTSGGLGPTRDDLTKEMIASFFSKPISFSEAAQKVAETNYSRLNRPYPGKDHPYSLLPEGFLALNNCCGFAPGLYAKFPEKVIFSAPGVPKEFQMMVNDYFPSLIFSQNPDNGLIEVVNFRTRRVPEEKIFSEVDPELWDKLEAFGDVSSLPVLFGVDIGVKIRAQTEEELQEKKQNVLTTFKKSPAHSHLWHIGNEPLEEVIIKLGVKKKATFGFAESATGGLCSHRITSVSGSGDAFTGSVVSYDSKVKAHTLGVEQTSIDTYGVVSLEVAKEMARGLARELKVSIAISITGYAGPTGGTADKPVGTVCIGAYLNGEASAEKFQFSGDREQLKARFAQAALMTLLDKLETFA